ncbi:MAG: CPBP family intramembrane metalloprotease [Ignavibacteriales bacterium]|nr:CPBP family intramembrane metalloprotease [Ignavibacteriales bacterium]
MNEEFKDQHEPKEEEPKVEIVKPFSTIPPITAAFIALIGIFLLYQFGGAILTIAVFGFNFEKADVNMARLLTMGGQILLMLFPTLLLAKYIYKENISLILRVKFPSFKEVGVFTVGLILLTPLLQNFLSLQTYALEKLAAVSPFVKNIMDMLDKLDKLVESTYSTLLTSHSVYESSFIIFVVAVIPALCEETLFRGFVQKSFEQKLKPFWSILITAVFFGLYHFNPYGLVTLIALGAYFGFAAYMSNSIFVPMALHFFNNLVAVLAFLFLGNEELIKTTVTKTQYIIPQLISFAMFATLFFAYIIFIKTNYNRIVSNK